MVGPGVPAASMFCEHLAGADDAALMRLVMVCLFRDILSGCLFFAYMGGLLNEKLYLCLFIGIIEFMRKLMFVCLALTAYNGRKEK